MSEKEVGLGLGLDEGVLGLWVACCVGLFGPFEFVPSNNCEHATFIFRLVLVFFRVWDIEMSGGGCCSVFT